MFLPSPSLSLFRFLEKGFVSSETGRPPFSNEWSFVSLNLTRTDPSPMRKALCSKTARTFRKAATRTLSRTVRDAILLQGDFWQIHHIIPLSLGGSNAALALVPDNVHRWIHSRIGKDTQNMEMGETRTVTIPWREGLVWTNHALDLYADTISSVPLPFTPSRERAPNRLVYQNHGYNR